MAVFNITCDTEAGTMVVKNGEKDMPANYLCIYKYTNWDSAGKPYEKVNVEIESSEMNEDGTRVMTRTSAQILDFLKKNI